MADSLADEIKEGEGRKDDDEEANIVKAMRFWQHPSLRDIPLEQKQKFLYEKGVTDAQIHKAWDRIMEEGPQHDVPRSDSHNLTHEPSQSPTSNPYSPPQGVAPPQHSRMPQIPYAASSPSPYNQNFPMSNPSMVDPYSSSQANPGYYPTRYEEEEGPGPFLYGLSMVGLGGLVGLTAAAAARWLNGGDFQLLPLPSLSEERQEQRLVLQDEAVNEEADGHHEEYSSDEEEHSEHENMKLIPEVQENFIAQLKSISESMEAQATAQEKILQKLSTAGTAFTNKSMDLLRASSGVSNSSEPDGNLPTLQAAEVLQVWAQLLEIKSNLRNIQYARKGISATNPSENLDQQLSESLRRLDECVETMQRTIGPAFKSSTTINPSATSSAGSNPPPKSEEVRDEMKSEAEESQIQKAENTHIESLSLRQAIRKVAQENDTATMRVGCQLLYLYLINLMGAPSNPRYRKIFTTNESFQKVDALNGGKDVLQAVGFEVGKGCLEWLASNASPEAEGLAVQKVQEASEALGILKSGKSSPELTDRSLAVISPDPDVNLQPPVPSFNAEQVASTEFPSSTVTGEGEERSIPSSSDPESKNATE